MRSDPVERGQDRKPEEGSLRMANLLYRDYFIMAVADFDHTGECWNLSIDISWRIDGGRRFQMLRSSQPFKGKEQAESFGLDTGKAWIDERN
jgi:hypothetical protein